MRIEEEAKKVYRVYWSWGMARWCRCVVHVLMLEDVEVELRFTVR